MPSEPPRPTDAELEILTVLWSLGAATVREVHDSIARRRAVEYATVLKFMQIMAEKGLVRRLVDVRTREWTQRQLTGHLMERAFGGSPRALLMGALSAKPASKKEFAEMRQVLDEYKKGNK